MNIKLQILLYTLICMMVISNCKRDVPCADDYDNFMEISEHYKQPLNSYSGYDTLKFKSEAGIIYTFYGLNGLDSSYSLAYEDNEFCPTIITHHKRYYYYQFKSNDYPTSLDYIVGYPPALNETTSRIFININKMSFSRSSQLPKPNNIAYLNNLIFENDTFNNVLLVKKDFNNSSLAFLYYSLEAGIIHIDFANGQTLTKVK
jgi:hypothetical protein